MHEEALGGEAGGEREVELSPGGDVAPEALLRKELQQGGGAVGLRGVDDCETVVPAGAAGGEEGAGAGAEVLLGEDVGGGAEFACELQGVAATDLQDPALVEGGVQREYV